MATSSSVYGQGLGSSDESQSYSANGGYGPGISPAPAATRSLTQSLGSTLSNAANSTPVGKVVNDVSGGTIGAAGSALQGQSPVAGVSSSLSNIGNKLGVGTSGANTQYGNAAGDIAAENSATDAVIGQQAVAGSQYGNALGAATSTLNQETASALNNYTAGNNAALQNWQTPNNATEQGIQGMYNQQAQGITNTGLQDYGVLSALGSQATANTLGSAGLPMTGGQIEALQGNNLSQASTEFGQAQGAANNLRQQGLQAGLNQNNLNFQNTTGVNQNNYNATTADNTQSYNIDTGLAGANYGVSNTLAGEQLGNIATTYGSQTGLATAQAQADAASQASKIGTIGNIAGSAVASALAPTPANANGVSNNALAASQQSAPGFTGPPIYGRAATQSTDPNDTYQPGSTLSSSPYSSQLANYH